MADFDAAPPVPGFYPRLAKLTAEQIAEARRYGYVVDRTDLTAAPWDSSDPLKYTSEMVEHGNNLRAWRGKLYLIWFCYVFENLNSIRRPLYAIEELFLYFRSNLIDDLAQMFAGCGAWDETITPEDWVRIRPVLQKYHARAEGLLANKREGMSA